MEQGIIYRRGRSDEDLRPLVELLSLSNDGLEERLWRDATVGTDKDWRDFGSDMLLDEHHECHPGNMVVAQTSDGDVAGMIVAVPLMASSDTAEPEPSDELAIMALRRIGGGSLYLRNMAVFDGYRGKGIALGLLNICIEAARGSGYPSVTAIIRGDNQVMATIYAKLGFNLLEEKSGRADEPECDFSRPGGDRFKLMRLEFQP